MPTAPARRPPSASSAIAGRLRWALSRAARSRRWATRPGNRCAAACATRAGARSASCSATSRGFPAARARTARSVRSWPMPRIAAHPTAGTPIPRTGTGDRRCRAPATRGWIHPASMTHDGSAPAAALARVLGRTRRRRGAQPQCRLRLLHVHRRHPQLTTPPRHHRCGDLVGSRCFAPGARSSSEIDGRAQTASRVGSGRPASEVEILGPARPRYISRSRPARSSATAADT
jgi:hypothetical protein